MIELHFFPSLKFMALNKVAVLMAVNKNVISSIPTSSKAVESWYFTKQMVMVKEIKYLPLPDSVKYELLATFKEIAINIQIWKKTNQKSNLFYEFLFENFHLVKWSPFGDIDDEETAKILLNLEILDVRTRYFLACYYCLESYILKLRPEAEILGNESLPSTRMVRSAVSVYWQSMQDLGLPRDSDQRRYTCKGLYLNALKLKNLGAMKFFYEKLSREDKRLVAVPNLKTLTLLLMDESKSAHSTSLFLFLLHPVKHFVLKNTLIKFAPDFLNYFLAWPMQKHFFDAFDQLFEYLQPKDFNYLLERIAYKSFDGWMQYAYHQAFRTVWLKGTESMKVYVAQKVKKNSDPFILHYLISDMVSRRLILSKAENVLVKSKEPEIKNLEVRKMLADTDEDV